MRPAPMAQVPSGTGSFLAAPTSRCARSTTNRTGYSARRSRGASVTMRRTRGRRRVAVGRVSTRTYIVLAALTGLVILVAFAVQLVVVS